MRHEPPIDRAGLVGRVRDAYGMPVRDLTFIPVGFEGACYVLRRAGGKRFFLKVWPDLRPGDALATRRHAALALARALRDRGVYARVPYPIPTRDGALWADLSGIPFAVFPFLSGRMPPYPMPLALRQRLARAMARLHRATPALEDVLPPRETFAIPGEADLARLLAAVERIGSETRPGLRALRRLVLPRQADILAQHARLRRLQAVVRGLDGPFVLCHTDLTGNNLFVDARGRLTILDWDWPALAPPEHDLWAAIGDDFGGVLDAYHRAGGARTLRVEHFAFYLLRRHVGDMLGRLERLLDADEQEDEDDELLRGMEAYGFARWSALDATLADIRAALA